MRRSLISQAVEEKDEPNITPMLDVVFILLIFFIVTLLVVYELGKKHAIEIIKQENQRISLDEKKNIHLEQSAEGKK